MPLGAGSKSQKEPSSPVKTPIILAKNDRSTSGETRSPSSGTGRLWKPESDVRVASSSKHGIPSTLQSGELPNIQPSYKIQQRNDLKSGGDWTQVSALPKAVKLIDGLMNWSQESLMEFLLEQNDYRVIGVLGAEGVGKTHIMSLIATHPRKIKSPFLTKDKSSNTTEPAGHSTSGLHAYVTKERTIILDCQPLFSSSVYNNIINNERKFSTDYNSSEDICDSVNLELIMFMLAVCHVVLVVENWFTDPNLHRALQIVDMLKPPQLPSEKQDDHNEFTSKIVFIQNMYSVHEPDVKEIEHMETTLTQIYSKSTLLINRKPSGEVKVLCLLQQNQDKDGSSKRKDYEQKLVQEVLTTSINPILSHTTLTEKNWLQYAGRMWEAVKKCPFLPEYIRLLVT